MAILTKPIPRSMTPPSTAPSAAPARAPRSWRVPLTPWVILPAIMATGLVVRLLWINALGFNSDEAVYAGQAASIAGNADLYPYFPIFRAHPLLFQTFLSLFYQDGTSDVVGRYVSVGFGMATVLLSYFIGKELYGKSVGNLTALIVAVMPYQVVVTRQVLLDGPMVTFSTLTLLLMAKYASTRRDLWLIGAGAALGLTSITKETGALLIGSIFAFLALSQHLGTRLRTALAALAAWYVVFLPYPLSLTFSGQSTTGRNFLAWQLFRRPNHTWDFYFSVVPPALGWGVVVFALVALVVAVRSGWRWRETLLVCWIVVPVVIFEIWPVKGFQYLLPISVPMAVLAAAGLVGLFRARGRVRRALATLMVVAVVLSCLVPTVMRIKPSDSPVFLAGSGGVPGGRETGEWIATHVPVGAQILTLGPSMANIVEFYGQRQAYGLSVSTNPLNRNPVYVPIDNPDLSIRRNQIQYIVWDAYSAARSPFFSSHLLRYAERYHGRVVHTEQVQVKSPDGSSVAKPVIIVYEVRP